MSAKAKGFTLIELVVVIVVVGILIAFSAFSVNMSIKKSRDASRQNDLSNVKHALVLYYNDNNKFPVQASGATDTSILKVLVDNKYIASIPVDPLNSKNSQYFYRYYTDADGSNFDLEAKLEDSSAKDSVSMNVNKNGDLTSKINGTFHIGSDAWYRLVND